MDSREFTDRLRCTGANGKLTCQRSNLLEDVVRSKIMGLMHSPDVVAWLQTHQSKRRRRKRQLPRRCHASHSDSTDSRDSALRRTSSGSDDIVESPIPDRKSVSSNSAPLCVSYESEELLNALCAPSSITLTVQHGSMTCSQSAPSGHTAGHCDISLNGTSVTTTSSTIRFLDVCSNGIWSKADSAFVSVVGVKSSKSSA